ncbi:membrane protein insertion efficiency factor YidD [candidate division KSB1 bacterium]|nr:membrane protein insertion efficiency factor YidD [candidate division KSB1 bacterium]
MAGMAMIRFYQLFISSQQNNQSVCIFTPSCSRFGLRAIKKYGLLQGILMTSDRLQRCHGFAGKYYQRPNQNGKYPDPIERYAWETFKQ